MKTLLLIIGLLGVSITMYGQEEYIVNMTYNTNIGDGQNLEATKLLYQEINYYREQHGELECAVNEKTVKYACNWGKYMKQKHVSFTDNFYKHSKFGPDSLHKPVTCSEIIHLLYFDHKPSNVEIVSGLMFGIARNDRNVIGWTQSEGHNKALLQSSVKYYGASIYVFREGKFWCVYGTVNFSTVK